MGPHPTVDQGKLFKRGSCIRDDRPRTDYKACLSVYHGSFQ